MATNEIYLPAISRNHFTNIQKLLGILAMIFSPMLFFGSFFYAPEATNPHQIFASLGGILYLSGVMASAIALRRLRVTGKGFGGAIICALQIVGLILAMTFDAVEYLAPQLRETALFFVCDMAYPFSHLMLLVVGFAILKTKIWRGWRTIPAFLIGLALPAFFALSAVTQADVGGLFFVPVTLGFFLLGLAIFTSPVLIEAK